MPRQFAASFAIGLKDGSPFGVGGIWENRKDLASGEWVRTFAIMTTDANELVSKIHDLMQLILAPSDYACWLGEEADLRGLMRSFPSEPMRMWPISTRVNKPESDDPSIVQPIEPTAAQGLTRARKSVDRITTALPLRMSQ